MSKTFDERWAEYTAAAAQFGQDHPEFCDTCQGWGVVGSGMMDRDTGIVDRDPCPACFENGNCPWCGEETVVDDTETGYKCSNPTCIWTDAANGLPEQPEDPSMYE